MAMAQFDDDEVDGFVLVSAYDEDGVDRHNACAPEVTGTLDEVSEAVAGVAEAFWPVNKRIHDNPELGFREFIAHDALTAFMRAQDGWKVTPSAYGMKTAWVAVFDTGKKGPVVSFNAEMDCLPGIGHACGHNLIATVSVLGAIAAAKVIKAQSMPGKVVLFGTPAEEGGGGKIKLLDAGAYSDHEVDISLISHPGIVTDSALMLTAAYERFKVEYFGRAAHAAANPWLGINALDALVTAYTNISVLRQQTMPGDIIQGRISDGGVAPNIIHAYAAGIFVVRADTQARLAELRSKVAACFEAGALASGATLKTTQLGAYRDHVPNRPLGRSYTRYFNALDPPNRIPEDQDVDAARGRTQASTDQGDVSYAMPSLSVGFALRPGPGGQGPHNPEFAEVAGTRESYERALRAAKGLAATALDVYRIPGFLDEVKQSWRDAVKPAKT